MPNTVAVFSPVSFLYFYNQLAGRMRAARFELRLTTAECFVSLIATFFRAAKHHSNMYIDYSDYQSYELEQLLETAPRSHRRAIERILDERENLSTGAYVDYRDMSEYELQSLLDNNTAPRTHRKAIQRILDELQARESTVDGDSESMYYDEDEESINEDEESMSDEDEESMSDEDEESMSDDSDIRYDRVCEFFSDPHRPDAALRSLLTALVALGEVTCDADPTTMSRTALRKFFWRKSIFIYIDDLVDYGNGCYDNPEAAHQNLPILHRSIKALRNRCKRHGTYPLNEAKAEGLRDFLREIFVDKRR